MLPMQPGDVVRGQYTGYRAEEGVDPESETETFIALKCFIDNWRWAGVPFFLRTGKRLAEGQRIISIAFREPPKSMFPPGSGVGAQGPDHLTFDLADASKMSLSFYGKRPGPGMRLDKLSLQFAMHDTGLVGDVLEAYERLILDAMRGDHTLFTTAEGIERLWEVSIPLLEAPPPVRLYRAGFVGAELDPPADRAARLAAAVRARLARSQYPGCLSRMPRSAELPAGYPASIRMPPEKSLERSGVDFDRVGDQPVDCPLCPPLNGCFGSSPMSAVDRHQPFADRKQTPPQCPLTEIVIGRSRPRAVIPKFIEMSLWRRQHSPV